MLTPPTIEQHRALLLEIVAEMTPEQLADAMKPVDWEAELKLDFQLEAEKPTPLFWGRFYSAIQVPDTFTVLSC